MSSFGIQVGHTELSVERLHKGVTIVIADDEPWGDAAAITLSDTQVQELIKGLQAIK